MTISHTLLRGTLGDLLICRSSPYHGITILHVQYYIKSNRVGKLVCVEQTFAKSALHKEAVLLRALK